MAGTCIYTPVEMMTAQAICVPYWLCCNIHKTVLVLSLGFKSKNWSGWFIMILLTSFIMLLCLYNTFCLLSFFFSCLIFIHLLPVPGHALPYAIKALIRSKELPLITFNICLTMIKGQNDCSIYKVASLWIASLLYSPINKFSSFNNTFSTLQPLANKHESINIELHSVSTMWIKCQLVTLLVWKSFSLSSGLPGILGLSPEGTGAVTDLYTRIMAGVCMWRCCIIQKVLCEGLQRPRDENHGTHILTEHHHSPDHVPF